MGVTETLRSDPPVAGLNPARSLRLTAFPCNAGLGIYASVLHLVMRAAKTSGSSCAGWEVTVANGTGLVRRGVHLCRGVPSLLLLVVRGAEISVTGQIFTVKKFAVHTFSVSQFYY